MRTVTADEIAANVEREVLKRGLTQRWVGQQIGLSQVSVWKRMRLRIEWRPSELDRLAAAMGVPVSAFLPPRPSRSRRHLTSTS